MKSARSGMRRSMAVVLPAVLMMITLTAAPASAGDCDTPGCGGEVSNNSSWKSVLISNCWDDDATYIEEGYFLDCQGGRVGNLDDAAIALQPGDWSSEPQYSEFYDTDAIRFPGGCVTTAHFWGERSYTTDRRGMLPLWGRIRNWNHFYIDGVSC
jgi:hypothetical protein